jgi:hypothetical protein
MNVRIGTKLEADGSGRFSIAMQVDRELRDQLEDSKDDRSGLVSIEGLFGRLQSQGWDVVTKQPAGGLSWEASKAFADSEAFDRVLDELGSAQGAPGERLAGIELTIDHDVTRSFLRTEAAFSGHIDTTGGEALDESTRKLVQALGEVIRFEIAADLPGAIAEQTGDGTVRQGRIVWRPRIGTALDFSARSTALNTGALLIVLMPTLGLAGAGAWLLVGRRRGPARQEPMTVGAIVTGRTENGFLAIEPDDVETIKLPEPDEEPV